MHPLVRNAEDASRVAHADPALGKSGGGFPGPFDSQAVRVARLLPGLACLLNGPVVGLWQDGLGDEVDGVFVRLEPGHALSSRPKVGQREALLPVRLRSGGCGKIRVNAKDFEEDVLNRLFSRLDPKQLYQPAAESPMGEELAELARLEAVKKQLAELAGAGEMDLSEFRAAKAANDKKIEVLRKVLAKSAERKPRTGLGPEPSTFGRSGTSWRLRIGRE